MTAQRFTAANATEALRQIKASLGPDAVVLSSRDVDGGVELVAIAADGLFALQPPVAQAAAKVAPAAAQVPPPTPAAAPSPPPMAQQRAARATYPAAPEASNRWAERRSEELAYRAATGAAGEAPGRTGGAPTSERPPAPHPTPAPLPVAREALPPAQPAGRALAAGAPQAPGMSDLTAQLSEMKHLLSGHLANNLWASLQQSAPGHAQLLQRLLGAGLSSKLVTQMLTDLPAVRELDQLLPHAQAWVQSRLQTLDAFSLFDGGGVFAFVGPTGVGKTTTVAKIAARCMMRYGRRQVALLTTDTFRIGAQEQLRVFARILNLPVMALRDSDDLQAKMADLGGRKIVLLDTAGVGQRDTMMTEQMEMIREGCAAVHRVLVMSATTATRTLDDVIESHHNAMGEHAIEAAVVTKIDEGVSLAPAMDCVIRHRLPLLFLANGQRVPEDLFAADAAYLAHRTVNPRGRDHGEALAQHVPALIADDIAGWTPHTKTA
jgi:flagellar biosynthesis protein FlhF